MIICFSISRSPSLSTWIGKELEEFSKIQNAIQFAFIKTASDIISWIKFFCWLGGHQQVLGQNAFMRYADPHGKPKKKKEKKNDQLYSNFLKFDSLFFCFIYFHKTCNNFDLKFTSEPWLGRTCLLPF